MRRETVTHAIDPYLDAAPQPRQKKFIANQWKRYRALSLKNQLAIALSVPTFSLMMVVGNRVMNPTVVQQAPYESEVQQRVDYESVDAPLNFLDITGAEYDQLAPQAQVDYLLAHLQNIEGRLLTHVNDNYTALLSAEAARLRQEAMKEGTGDRVLDMTDPTGTLDMAYCLDQMQTYQCVLLRYAGDGLKQVSNALAAKDVAAYSQGVTRYQAALYALNDLQPMEKDSSSLLILADNYRILLRKVVARSPASQRPPVSTQGAGMKGDSPIRTFVEQQGYKSEQLEEGATNVPAE